MTFTEEVKQEIARALPDRACDRRAELAGLLAVGGTLRLVGGRPDPFQLELTTPSGAVARAAVALLSSGQDLRPEIRVHAPSAPRRRSTYAVLVTDGARNLGHGLGLVDEAGRPRHGVSHDVLARPCDRVAFVRGAFLAGGTISTPGRPPHLEVVCHEQELATDLASLVRGLAGGASVAPAGARGDPNAGAWRVVLKSGERIGALLAALGATGAFLTWDDQRLRHQLRADATRLANADSANLRRSTAAAATQVVDVTRTLERVGWAGLPEDLLEVALVRLANPSASLTELGELCDPPIGRAAVLRRLRRVATLALDAPE